jgi:lysine-specific permease
MIYFLMAGLGELATFAPSSGSFSTFSERYVDPALGFASGWNETVIRSVIWTMEVLTAGILIQFWLPDTPTWPFELSIFALIFFINAFTVRSFGEIEFWIASIKIVTVVLFVIVGFLRIFGAIGEPAYFKNWTYKKAPFFGGFGGALNALVVAGFSFVGSELVGITSAESKNPSKDVPRAINQVFFCMLPCYVMSIFVVACLLPYDHPSLLGSGSDSVTKSPFTIVLASAGIPAADHIMNAAILTAVMSSGLSMAYTSCRMLYSLSNSGKAPMVFGRTFSSGVPFWSLLASTTMALIVYGISKVKRSIYEVLISMIGIAGFVNWFTIAISHFRFRRAYLLQGHFLRDLSYYARFFPVGPIVVMTMCVAILICHDMDKMSEGKWGEVIPTYGSFILVVVLFVIYKITLRTQIVPLGGADLRGKTTAMVGPDATPMLSDEQLIFAV